jgi:membrane-associated phospholipid phosphatase
VPVSPANGSSTSRPWRAPAWLADAQRVDEAIYAAITRTPTPSLDRDMRRLTQAANLSRLWLGCAAVLALTRGERGRRAAFVGLSSVTVASAAANLLIKPLGRRRRPDHSDLPAGRRAPMPASTSFPSGHSASAFAFATGVGSVLPREARAIRALAVLVAYSRVHTGVHYPADVVAGAFLGTAVARVSSRVLGVRPRGADTGLAASAEY